MRKALHGRDDPALVVVGLALALTACVLPFGTRHIGATTGFLPAVLATVACFDVMSVWLLAGEYLDSGHRRHLGMAAAYLWSLLLMACYGFAFPGVVSSHPPLATSASVAPYLYLGWHVGFPTLLGFAWGPWGVVGAVDGDDLVGRRRRTLRILGATTVGALGVVALVVGFARRLPPLIHGLDLSAMTRVTAPVAIPLVLVALVLCGRGVRGRAGPERWTFVAVLVCLCDLVLTYTSRYRYSLGWYAGRTMTVIAAALVLIAMLASFRRLKATAEHNAAFDHLTALPNRRSAWATLTMLVAHARRTASPLSVLMLDLDHFKAVNDDHGHATGDEVLRAVGQVLRFGLRQSDTAARLGGEEFLLVLPNTGPEEAMVVAQRLRESLAGIRVVPGLTITASCGVATLSRPDRSVDDLLSRADRAMYGAKSLGRDRSCLADDASPDLSGADPALPAARGSEEDRDLHQTVLEQALASTE